ncbi:hypothetical protein TESG_02167 [Trichophyton tonsurans CBS 112818]|uniref:Uncharacterized protein n=1 Tax=Trichophyton tonsurans (strain CBS 112818) TaxID=647933 RepID=F2RTL0_TRIT1|nr:hypothetical protein TESG_02167 [Trichophyton tonsurans CBS 112818]
MAPSEKTAKPTSELSGSPALTHLTSNSSGSDSKPQIMSKEERHQEELVEFLKKAGHWDGDLNIPYDTDDDIKYEKGEKIT